MQDKNPPGKKIKWMNFWEDLLGATPNPFGGEAVVQNERSRDPKPLRGYGIQVGLPADKGAAVFQLSFAIRAQENSFFKFQIFYLFSIFSSCSRHFRFRCLPLKSPNFWCSTKNFFFFWVKWHDFWPWFWAKYPQYGPPLMKWLSKCW